MQNNTLSQTRVRARVKNGWREFRVVATREGETWFRGKLRYRQGEIGARVELEIRIF